MIEIKKKMIVAHSAEHMFDLVDQVEHYPDFLPWCAGAKELKREGNLLEAVIDLDYMKIKQQFGTRNINTPGRKIEMSLLTGPFRYLDGLWEFTPMGSACRIDFVLHYEFSAPLLSRLIGPVFGHVSGSLINAFVQEANRRYGR